MKRFLLPGAFLLLALYLLGRTFAGGEDLDYYSPETYVDRADRLIERGYLEAECVGDGTRIVGRWPEGSELDREWYEDSYLRIDVERFNGDLDRYGWTFVIDGDCRLLGVNPIVHTITLPFARDRSWLGSIFYSGQGSDSALRSAQRSLFLNDPEASLLAERQKVTAVGASGSVSGEAVLLVFGGVSRPAARLYPVGPEVVVNNRVKEGEAGQVRLLGRRLPPGRISRLEPGDWLHLGLDGGASETFVYTSGEARPVASAVRLRNDAYHRETADDALGWVPDPSRDEWRPFLETFASSIDRSLEALPEETAARLRGRFDLQLTVQRELQTRLNELLHDHFRDLSHRPEVRDDFEAGVTVMDGLSGDVLAAVTYPWPEDVEGSDDDGRSLRRRLQNQNFIRHPVGSAAKPFLFAAAADAYPFLLDLEIDEHLPEERHQELLHCWLPLGYQLLDGHYGRIDFRRALEISCNKYTVELALLGLAAEQGRMAGGEAGLLGGLRQRIPPDPEIEDWPPAETGSGVYLGGRALSYAPDLRRFLLRQRPVPEEEETTAVRRCDALDHLEAVEMRYTLETLTGASTYRGEAPTLDPSRPADRERFYASYVTQLYDLRPWRPLLRELVAEPGGEPSWGVRAALQEVSPERVNLAFNNVTDLRRDFVSMALGGASSVWTNLQLAEATSRLVTGRQVEAGLIRRVLPRESSVDGVGDAAEAESEESASGEADLEGDVEEGGRIEPANSEATTETPELLPLRAEAREAVLEGMARVIEGPQGTARSNLRGVLRDLRERYREDDVYLFSKTGSPVLERPVSGSTAQALERIVPGYVDLADDRLRVRLEGETEIFPARGDRTRFARLLSKALRQAGVSGNRDRLSWRLVRVFARFAKHSQRLSFASQSRVPSNLGDIDGPLYAVDGRLRLNRRDPLFTRRLLRDKGAVYVFSLVRVPKEVGVGPGRVPTPEQLSEPGVQIRTVALHLTVGPDSEVAVRAARKMLERVDLFE